MEERSSSNPDVSIRKYAPGDIPACARLAKEAWPADPGIASDESERSGMEGYMEYSLSVSNWAEIAQTPEGIVGFLFGRIDNYPGRTLPKKSPMGELSSILRSVFDHDGEYLSNLRFIWSIALTELKLKLLMPKSDANIEMFIVASKHRGMGVGGELVGRFLSAAREAGSSLVTVYTDDRMSDWKYYERRGFKKIGTFYDNITSHYSGSDARGIIFALDLKDGEKENF